MSFLFAAALGVVLLAVAPFVAHLLQRRRADERDFPPGAAGPSEPTGRPTAPAGSTIARSTRCAPPR